jgi:hypothetical protein
MSDRGFPEHFDGRRFYNPGAPQARGFLDVLRWKLRSRPESSPAFMHAAAQPYRTLSSGFGQQSRIRVAMPRVAIAETRVRSAGSLSDPEFMYRGWGTPLANPWDLNRTKMHRARANT